MVIFLTVFYLQRYLYRKWWEKGLAARVRFSENHVYQGDTVSLTEEIVNDKQMPLPAVEIRFALDKELSYLNDARENASVSDKNYRRDVFSLFARQKTIRSFPVACQRRGYYEIRELEMVGYDFFFQKKYFRTLPQDAALYVYPRQVDIRRIRLVHQALSGMRLVQNRLYQDPFAFAGIRAYDPTDPMNRINWKASAKSGELMVNQFDATTNICVRCFLDVADSHILKYPHLVEEGISIVTSLAVQLVTDHMDLDVIGNAQRLSLSLKAGTDRLDELYRALACIQTDHISCSMGLLLREESRHVRENCLYLLVSKNDDEETVQGAQTLAAAGANLLWVLPADFRSESGRERQENGIKLMRWEVES